MRLTDAMLCLDCDEIGLKATHCMLCGSGAVVDVAKWIKPLDAAREQIRRERAEDVMQEVREMHERISCMMIDMGEEPLGCGA